MRDKTPSVKGGMVPIFVDDDHPILRLKQAMNGEGWLKNSTLRPVTGRRKDEEGFNVERIETSLSLVSRFL
jgi:hypothetical protein